MKEMMISGEKHVEVKVGLTYGHMVVWVSKSLVSAFEWEMDNKVKRKATEMADEKIKEMVYKFVGKYIK